MAKAATAGSRQEPLAEVPPRNSRFGSLLVLSRVHWVRPEMVVEVSYLTLTEDGLLRQVERIDAHAWAHQLSIDAPSALEVVFSPRRPMP